MPSLCSINIDASESKLDKLQNYLAIAKPDVLAIQDLPSMSANRLKQRLNKMAPEYSSSEDFISHPSIAGQEYKCQTIILANKSTTSFADRLSNSLFYGQRSFSVTMPITIQLKTTQLFYFTCIYIRPKSSAKETRKHLQHITELCKQFNSLRHIILGDFNTQTVLWAPMRSLERQIKINKHQANWNYDFRQINAHYERVRRRARLITHFVQVNRLTAMNDTAAGPTYVNIYQNHRTYIDAILMGQSAKRFFGQFTIVDLDQHMRHNLLCIDSKFDRKAIPAQLQDYRTFKTVKVYNWHRLHAFYFNDLQAEIRLIDANGQWKLKNRRDIIAHLEHITKFLQTRLVDAQRSIQSTKKIILPYNPELVSANVREQEKFQNEAKKRWLPKFKRVVKKVNQQRTRADAKALDDAWKEARKLKAILKPNLSADQAFVDDENKNHTNQFEQSNDTNIDLKLIKKILDEKFAFADRSKAFARLSSIQSGRKEGYRVEITESEFDVALGELLGGKKKYVGPDGIGFKLIERTIVHIKPTLMLVAQMSFYASHSPRSLLVSRGKLIPKKEAGKFRIVHISCAIMAILERIALHRVEYLLENRRLMSPYQFGFVPLQGRFELVARLFELMFKHRMYAIAHPNDRDADQAYIIGLDIEGAFDNIDQNELISKICNNFGANEPMSAWLADFILHRNVEISYGQDTSKCTAVCKGVPQGSSLGPILWNLAINDLDSAFKRTREQKVRNQKGHSDEEDVELSYCSEMLCFADDIVILHFGSDLDSLQLNLDAIVGHLARSGLKLSAAKSTLMQVKLLDSSRNPNSIGTKPKPLNRNLSISNEPIPEVETTSILGIPITKHLSLETTNKRLIDAIYENARILKTLKQLKLVKGPKAWQILFASYIQSVIIDKNLPIFIISESSRKWADQALLQMARFIFNWPETTSQKVIRLNLNLLSTRQLIERLFNSRFMRAGSLRDSYLFLEKIFECGLNFYDANYIKISPLELNNQSRPRFNKAQAHICSQANMYPVQTELTKSYLVEKKIVWLMIETSALAVLVQLKDGSVILTVKAYKHSHQDALYLNSFLNSLAALYNFAEAEASAFKTASRFSFAQIVMSAQSSLYQALTNAHNHDWRIVMLRDAICNNNCRIASINNIDYSRLRKHLLKRLDLDGRKNANRSRTNIQTQLTLVKWPTTGDYISRNIRNKHLNEKQRKEFIEQNFTGVTSSLCKDPQVWQNISPSALNSFTFFTLAGMMIDNTENLTRCLLEEGQQLSCCHQRVTSSSEKYLSLHKLFECSEPSISLRYKVSELIDKLRTRTKHNQNECIDSHSIADSELTEKVEPIMNKQMFCEGLKKQNTKYLCLRVLASAANFDKFQ